MVCFVFSASVRSYASTFLFVCFGAAVCMFLFACVVVFNVSPQLILRTCANNQLTELDRRVIN